MLLRRSLFRGYRRRSALVGMQWKRPSGSARSWVTRVVWEADRSVHAPFKEAQAVRVSVSTLRRQHF